MGVIFRYIHENTELFSAFTNVVGFVLFVPFLRSVICTPENKLSMLLLRTNKQNHVTVYLVMSSFIEPNAPHSNPLMAVINKLPEITGSRSDGI